MTKRLLCILLSLALLIASAAAFAESAETEPAAAPEAAAEAPAAETAPAEEPVLLAVVNGEEITTAHPEVEYWINYYMYQLSMSGYDTTDPELEKTVRQYALFNTMRFIVIRQKAAEYGLDQFTDEEKADMEARAKSEWEGIVENYMAGYGITDESSEEDKAAARADAEAALLEEGYDEATYVREYMDSELNNTLITRLTDYVAGDVTVTDEDVENHFMELVREDEETYSADIGSYEFYTQYYMQPSYYTPEGYRAVTHILLDVDETLLNTWLDLSARYEEQQSAGEEAPVDGAPSEAPAETAEPVTLEQVQAAEQAILDSVQPTVDEIMGKLSGGASFNDLIIEYGKDPGMLDEATRAKGYPVHKDSILWDPAFTSAAMELENVGDVSKPVVGQHGVHILYYLGDIPAGAVELTDEMREEFRAGIVEEKKSAALNASIDQWMSEADITYTETGEAWKLPVEDEAAEPETEPESEPAAEEEAVPPAGAEATPSPEDAPEEAAP